MSNKIKFTLSNSGSIDFGNNQDALSALFTIGAIMETRKLKDEAGYEYATDEAGLKALLSHSESSLELILDMIRSLSLLLTTVSVGGYERELENAYWLLSGLSSLAGYLANANPEIQHAILKAETGQ